MNNHNILHTPSEWSQIYGIEIIDIDGWRGIGGRSFYDEIDQKEWEERMRVSTIRPVRSNWFRP